MSKAGFNAPKSGDREDAAMPYQSGEEVAPAETVRQKLQARLMEIEGVEGVGIGQDAIGDEGIVVYVRDAEAAKRIPRTLDGLKVIVQVTGPIDALKR